MAFCAKCGRQLADEAIFCPSCGTPVAGKGTAPAGPTPPPTAGAPPISGFDALTKDQKVQGYWLERLIALIIDGVIIVVGVGILSFALAFPSILGGLTTGNFIPASAIFGATSALYGVIAFFYFALADHLYSATAGKAIMGLKVTTLDGHVPRLDQTLIRNISKIYWLILLLDVIVGLAIQKDYRQKYSDVYAKTLVVKR
jgi:uncharacterized RDD family membrane protein YckC